MSQFNGILDDVGFVPEFRRDVDGRVGNHDRTRVGRYVHQKHMADPSVRSQPGRARNDRRHQFVSVQAAFHERFGLAVAHQRDCRWCRVSVMFDADNANRTDIKAVFFGDGAYSCFRANQRRCDKSGFGRHQGAFEGLLLAGMNDGHGNRRQTLGASDECLQAGVFVGDGDVRQFDA